MVVKNRSDGQDAASFGAAGDADRPSARARSDQGIIRETRVRGRPGSR